MDSTLKLMDSILKLMDGEKTADKKFQKRQLQLLCSASFCKIIS